MYNGKKDAIKLLSLILVVLIVPLIFISLETIQRLKIVSSINPNEVVNNTLDELYKNITSVPKNNDASTLRRTLIEIFDLMNDKDYEKLYSLLSSDMKSTFFNTKEDFINYMEASYLSNEKYSPKFSTYQKLNKEDFPVFIVNVNFLPHSTKEIEIKDTPDTLKSDTFTIYMTSDSTYKFSFLSYIGTDSSKHEFENDHFICKIASTNLYMNKTTFNIEITNKTDKDIFINPDEVYVRTGLMPKYYSSLVLVPANSKINFLFDIYTGLKLKDSLPGEVYFEGVHVDGMVYLFYLPIKYPVKLSSMYI